MQKVLRTILFVLVTALFGVSCNAIFGLEPLEAVDPEFLEKCNGSLDLEGCVCETPSAVRDCYHGVPGPDSACNLSGTQQCTPDGATRHWGPCEGGALPEATETCFDTIDNNCDGKVNEGCPCSSEYNMCRDPATGALLPANDYNFFTVPDKPVADEPFKLFVVSMNDLSTPRIKFNNLCYGGGGLKECAEVGSECEGWNVARFDFGGEGAGKHGITLYVNDPDVPCDIPSAATWSLEILQP